jgi:hypothetical protein
MASGEYRQGEQADDGSRVGQTVVETDGQPSRDVDGNFALVHGCTLAAFEGSIVTQRRAA